jgi:hypothetical protein
MYQRLKFRSLKHQLTHTVLRGCVRMGVCLPLCAAVFTFTPDVQAAVPIDLEWQGADPQQRLRVDQAVNTYRLLDTYADKTFQGKRPITRYELADAIGRLQKLVHQRYQVPISVEPRMAAALQIYFQPSGDIPTRHWATPMILQGLSTGVLQGEQYNRDLRFNGLQTLSQAELEAACFRVLDWLQIAPKEPLSILGIVPFGMGSSAKQTPASRYDLAMSMVNIFHYIEGAAKIHSLLPKVVIPMPIPETQLPTRIDGRRLPVNYLPRGLTP